MAISDLDLSARLQCRMTRWAHPELPCKTLALARAAGADSPEESAMAAVS